MKRFTFCLIYALLAGFGLLGIAILVFGEKESRASEGENRMLAGFPEMTVETLADGSFMTGMEDYLEDAMFQRDRIISFSEMTMELFSVRSDEERQEETQQELEQQIADRAEAVVEDDVAETDVQKPEIITEASSEEQGQEDVAVKDKSKIPKSTFYFLMENGSKDLVYTFSPENTKNAVELFDTLQGLLPEDGRVYFGQVPFPATGSRLTNKDYHTLGWVSEVDAVLEEYCGPNYSSIPVTEILQEHIVNGEQIYFRTDHHWTPRAASYVADYLEESEGYPHFRYSDYSFATYDDFRGTAKSIDPGITPERIDILIPSLPTRSFVVSGNGTEKEMEFIFSGRHDYLSYLGGTYGPWRRFVTGVNANRRCLIVSDSYANCLIPFLTPYYDEIHSVNLSTDYITPQNAGFSLGEYITRFDIDDIIIIPSTSSSVNSSQLKTVIWKYINLHSKGKK